MNKRADKALPPLRKAALLLALGGILTACDQGKAPEETKEYAVKGFYGASLSDDGQFAAVGSIHHGGSLWQTSKGERLFNWNHKEGQNANIIATGFSPEGRFALTADHQTMVLWNTETGAADTFWAAPNEVLDLDLSSNGNYALLGLGDYTAVIFDVKRGGVQRTFYHQNRVSAVALSNDGRFALTGSDDSSAKLWDIKTGKQLQQFDHEDQVVTVALTSKGDKALTIAKYDKAAIWDTATGKLLDTLPLKPTAIKRGQTFTSARFSDDGKLLLTGNSDRTVQLWDVKTLKPLAQWTVPKRDPWKPTSAAILAVSFGPGNKQFFAIASNGFAHRLKR